MLFDIRQTSGITDLKSALLLSTYTYVLRFETNGRFNRLTHQKFS